MLEQTNQAGTELDFKADDFSKEELAVETVDKPEEKPAEPQKMKIKYNGKDEEYSTEELIALAQKGRNYDHVVQERDAIKNSEELSVLQQLAKDAGAKDTKEYVAQLKANFQNQKFDKRVKELEAEGMKNEHAKRMAEMELSTQKPVAVVEPNPVEPLVSQFNELFAEFPETQQWKDLSEYPEEVQTMIQDGKSPLVAYTKYITAQKDEELKVAKQNAEAKSKDTGSFKSVKKDEKEDDFLKGLMGK